MPSDYLHRASNSLRGSLLSAVHVEFRRLLDFTHVLALTCFVLSCVLPNENVWISANLSLLKNQPPIRFAKKISQSIFTNFFFISSTSLDVSVATTPQQTTKFMPFISVFCKQQIGKEHFCSFLFAYLLQVELTLVFLYIFRSFARLSQSLAYEKLRRAHVERRRACLI